MIPNRLVALLVLPLGAVAACESAPPGAATDTPSATVRARPTIDPADDRQWDSSITLFEQLAGIVEKHQDDCAELASAIEAFVADHGKALQQLKAHEDGLHGDQKKALERKYGKRAEKADRKIQAALKKKCGADPQVQQAMASIPLQ
jgi:hypothetical protein